MFKLFKRKATEVDVMEVKDVKKEYADKFERTLLGITDLNKNAYIDAQFKVKEFIDAGDIDKAKAYYDVLIARENELIRAIKYNLTIERMHIDRDLGV